jgi:protein-disulfide isomerase-like protein with CxxC motif
MAAVGACTALIDAGTLDPMCSDCWRATGKALAMHPDIEAQLESLGLREEGWRRLGQLNDELD